MWQRSPIPLSGTNPDAPAVYFMTYQQQQLHYIERIEQQFKSGSQPSTIVEPVADYITDNRICLTSVIYLPKTLTDQIVKQISLPLSALDSRQYFFPPDALHLTIQNIRVIANPTTFTEHDIEKVKTVFSNVIPTYQSFHVHYERLFELPTSFSLCAFTDETFGNLVAELRSELVHAGVPDDKSYASDTIVIGSTTIARYTTTPNTAFIEKLHELKHIEIGDFEAKIISLIATNAVCRKEKTTLIDQYILQ